MSYSRAVRSEPKRLKPEEILQRSVKAYLDLAAPDLIWYSCPNGGVSKGQNGRNKAMGAKAGVPDLHFVFDDGRVGYIELKAAKGVLSDAQIEFRGLCAERCIPWALCRSGEEVERTLRYWGVKLRGTFGDPFISKGAA